MDRAGSRSARSGLRLQRRRGRKPTVGLTGFAAWRVNYSDIAKQGWGLADRSGSVSGGGEKVHADVLGSSSQTSN